jgi:2-keto-4-pentenoate hydratase/2-oxohepta-3-ene-1,7-dioic acid hydratase in catechol pathway
VAPLDRVRLLAPVLPSKVLCVGRNYAQHAAELGNEVPAEPLIFLKPATSVIGPGEHIRLPALSNDVQHEAELAVVIGRLTRKVAVEDALGAVLGYTCANDVTARDLQRSDGQWTRGKGFDTFCPLGPWIETELDPAAGLAVRCTVDGEIRQDGSTADLLFSVGQLVAYCAAFTTLLPGDVLLTGTPAGVGQLRDGNQVSVSVEGIGELTNLVAADT